MALEQKLDLKGSQQLIMTPQLREAIGLLQLSNIELSTYLEKEMEQNPFLEKPESDQDESQYENEGSDRSETPEVADNFDEEGFDAGSSMASMGSGGNSKFESSDSDYTERLSEEKDLRSHLTEQIMVMFPDQRDRMLAVMLIDHLDANGYMRDAIKDISKQLQCSEERLDRIATRLKGCDPVGIFAGDLEECLALQLADQELLNKPMTVLLENLPRLADADMAYLRKVCGVEQEQLTAMISALRACDPKPAAKFDHVIVQTAIPDVLMKPLPKHVGGGWKVELNQETLPKVLVNKEYHAVITGQCGDKKDIKYFNDQLNSADWLARALDQRAQTILKVATAIIDQQDAFFLFGVEYLKPLTLRDIAEDIEMHESTVSRVTMNKFIGTPLGLFELKFFFTSGVSSSSGSGDGVSATAIKSKIKALIDNEDPKKILSDDRLAELLQEQGIDIARRTVAKYREALKIPSSPQRRRQKKNALLNK